MINPEDILLKTYPEPPTSGMMVGIRNQGIEIFHTPTKIGVIVDSERSQHLNKEKALAMLEILLELERIE
jgi:protein subunit release factor A